MILLAARKTKNRPTLVKGGAKNPCRFTCMKIAKAMIGVKSTYLPAYREGLFTYMGGFSRNRGVYSPTGGA